jgi:hypothetical protein
MPAIASFGVSDGAATPVNHIFNPNGIVNDVAKFLESGTYAIGNKEMSFSVRRSPQTGKFTVVQKFTVPIVVEPIVNGIGEPRIARVARGELTLTFDQTSTRQERLDFLRMFTNGTRTGTIGEKVAVDLENVW